jgi:extracellular elastinolytic metalloproteinase
VHPLTKRADASLEDSAIAFVESHLGVSANTVSFRSGFDGDISSHAFVRQTHDGIPFANAVANVGFNKDNKVTSFGSSFVKTSKSIIGSLSFRDV